MSNFSRVPIERASEFSDIASMHSIPHDIIQFDEGEQHAVFQFITTRDKGVFDHYVQEETGFQVDVHTPTINMLDAVVNGADPVHVVEAVTKGMQQAYAKMGPVKQCSSDDCNVTLPKYQGRYPKLCPACGSPIVKSGQHTKPASHV